MALSCTADENTNGKTTMEDNLQLLSKLSHMTSPRYFPYQKETLCSYKHLSTSRQVLQKLNAQSPTLETT